MRALRPVLRRQLLNSARTPLPDLRTTHPLLRRFQHGNNNYGPHKEYFQTPGQAPVPDTSPYDPREPVRTVPLSEGPSLVMRAIRGFLWGTLFCVLGLGAGTAFITWDYLQPPYEPGSPEEQDLMEEIEDLLNTHPLVLQLREEGWTEEDFSTRRPLPDRSRGLHMVHDTLSGSSQTLIAKSFKNESFHSTLVVFFVGFGVDGFPEVMHGGVTATMMLESVNKHIASYRSDYTLAYDRSNIDIDYKNPVRPGEIYTVMVSNGSPIPDLEDFSKERLHFSAVLLRLEAVPKMTGQWVSPTTFNHIVEIQSSTGESPLLASGDVTIPVIKKPRPNTSGLKPTLFTTGEQKPTEENP